MHGVGVQDDFITSLKVSQRKILLKPPAELSTLLGAAIKYATS